MLRRFWSWLTEKTPAATSAPLGETIPPEWLEPRKCRKSIRRDVNVG